jgi:hypothetical protein
MNATLVEAKLAPRSLIFVQVHCISCCCCCFWLLLLLLLLLFWLMLILSPSLDFIKAFFFLRTTTPDVDAVDFLVSTLVLYLTKYDQPSLGTVLNPTPTPTLTLTLILSIPKKRPRWIMQPKTKAGK